MCNHQQPVCLCHRHNQNVGARWLSGDNNKHGKETGRFDQLVTVAETVIISEGNAN